MKYGGRNVVVTGGLGFIGSNLAIRLSELGANVTIIDNRLDGCGANLHNISPIAGAVRVIEADVADAHRFADVLTSASVIFNLAGEISHVHSMQFPERDLNVNTLSQLRFLLTCKDLAVRARIVYAGTRQIYGAPRYLPVDEGHPIRPVDFNGVHKFAAMAYHLMLTRTGFLDCAVLRLTNVYGPRMALDAVCQGFLSTFLRRMMQGQPIEIFGDGSQQRDPMYVTDAVEAFLVLGAAKNLHSRCYNAGGPGALSLAEIADVSARVSGGPPPVFQPFPADRKCIDIGSYRSDFRRLRRDLGWQPQVHFEEGMRRTFVYYQQQLPFYLDPHIPNPPCRMQEHRTGPRHLRYVPQKPAATE